MANELTVAVDLDDTTTDFFGGVVVRAMNTEFDTDIDIRDITTWDNNAVKDFDWQAYGYEDWWDWLQQHGWLWATAPAIDGALGGIAALRHRGHQPECVTAKPRWAEPQVWAWFKKWNPAFGHVRITDIDEPKHAASDADILVDDRPSNILGWVNSDPTRFGILFERPWNRDEAMDSFLLPRIFYARDWRAVLDTVDTLERS